MADEELIQNIRQNNGEFATAIVLLMSLIQKLDAKLGDPTFTQAVNEAKQYIKGVGIAGRNPPGCVLPGFENLSPGLRSVIGEGWREFFDQPTP
jgi:hypothetical protein